MRSILLTFFISISIITFSKSQDVLTVKLSELGYLDHVSMAISTFFEEQALSEITAEYFEIEPSIFPVKVGPSKYNYFTVYTPLGDGFIDILVKPGLDGDSLYFDKNNDNDLTNDGGPFFFPSSEQEFKFSITQPVAGLESSSYRSLLRYPSYFLKDTTGLSNYFEEYNNTDGSMNQERTIYWQRHNSKFTGELGTFYYTERRNLTRGTLQYKDKNIHIGLHDRNANGLFADDDDLLIIDLDMDNHLTTRNRIEVFNFTDTLVVFDSAFIVDKVDPFGESITLLEVEKPKVFKFITSAVLSDETSPSINFGKINPEFWSKTYANINGDSVDFSALSNKTILLNFWGDWCQPCYKEMPLLANLNQKSSSEITIVSFLLTGDLEKAREVISEQNLDWPHILLTEEMSSWFNVSGYPSNFIIQSSDKPVILTNGIDEEFIERYLFD